MSTIRLGGCTQNSWPEPRRSASTASGTHSTASATSAAPIAAHGAAAGQDDQQLPRDHEDRDEAAVHGQRHRRHVRQPRAASRRRRHRLGSASAMKATKPAHTKATIGRVAARGLAPVDEREAHRGQHAGGQRHPPVGEQPLGDRRRSAPRWPRWRSPTGAAARPARCRTRRSGRAPAGSSPTCCRRRGRSPATAPRRAGRRSRPSRPRRSRGCARRARRGRPAPPAPPARRRRPTRARR